MSTVEITALKNDVTCITSIIQIHFDDKSIDRQWKQRYEKLYSRDIPEEWTPLFAFAR